MENSLFLSLLVSSVGFGLFIYGKKQQRLPQLISGLVCMVYPYFTSTASSMLVVGDVIAVCLWAAIRMGW